MKKNTKTIIILLLALTIVASLAVMAACVNDKSVTLTVVYGLDGVSDDTLTVEVGKPFYDKLSPPQSNYTFVGWYLDEQEVTSSTLAPNGNFTVKARWNATYRVEYWLEKQGQVGEFERSADLSIDSFATLGSVISAEVKEIRGYIFDENNASNVASATLTDNGVTLKLYYKRAAMTVTFDKLIESASGTMTAVSGAYGTKITLPACSFTSKFTFVGWNTARDGSGANYADGAEFVLTDDVTLYAQWQTNYKVVTHKEEYVQGSFETTYIQHSEEQKQGIIGRKVSVEAVNPDASKYVLNATDSVLEGVLTEQEKAFTAYFDLRAFEIRYMDDNTVVYVKYGSNHTVRTPENTDPSSRVRSYCTSSSGNGRDYAFGDVITNVTENKTLYPIILDVYTDDAGSGDTLEMRRNFSGTGAATLYRDGVSYSCYVDVTSTVEFEATVGDVTVHGKPYKDESGNLFRYRNEEEVGTYILFDYLFDDFYPTEMITFDGYGMGVYAVLIQGGELIVNYYATYEYEEGVGYWLEYFAVDAPDEVYGMYIELARYRFDIEGYENIDGYFMILGDELYYNPYYLYYNGELQDLVMVLDGHGNAYWYDMEDNQLLEQGIYYASENYEDAYPEYVYAIPKSGSLLFEFDVYFILYPQYDANLGYYGLVLVRRGEYGVYTATESDSYPELYLDGYGGAEYIVDAKDSGRIGSYIIQPDDEGYIVLITFRDDDSVLAVRLNQQNKTYTVFENGFVVDAQGVLTAYLGKSSIIVIPEVVNGVTVKEIAADVFSYLTIDVNITSVTFPATLERIGDRAFENAAGIGDASVLRTAIFLGEVPPVLGEDVFRWIKSGNFHIYVPEGFEEVYRNADTWKQATASQPNGYAAFVTSYAEQANKPEFEIVDGVLLSYNNKDDKPRDVHVQIPAGVTEISSDVFAGLGYIVSVDLNGVTVIGKRAFYGCVNLTQITFNRNTVSIGSEAFYECVGLTSVDLGEVETIGTGAFARCFALVSVNIGSKIKFIGNQAFFMCAQDVNADETDYEMHELIVTIAATVAPELDQYVFMNTHARIYVQSYEVGLSYADNSSWARYAASLRLKRDGAAETWYSKANVGAILVLGDAAMFDESYIGLYKWDGESTLIITWFEYGALSQSLRKITSTLTLSDGELSGLYFDDELEGTRDEYVLVAHGTTLVYKNGTEQLEITFGVNEGKFNGRSVQIEVVNYRTQFELDGQIYHLTLTNDLTFTYTVDKITVTKQYTATDGSTLTVFYGNYVSANGRLKNVNGVEIYTEYQGWYLVKIADGVYTFKWNHATGNYSVIVTLHDDGAFEYTWSIYSTVTTYRNATGDIAVVTTSTDTGEIMSISILFKTANGSESQIATVISGSNGVYTVEINGTVRVTDAEGNTHEEPSEFNGTYTLTLTSDGASLSFTLELISSAANAE